jgi:hypothetical protein
MRDQNRLKARLTAVISKQREALDQLGRLLSKTGSTPASIQSSQEIVTRLTAQYQRLVQELKVADLEKPERYGSANSRSGQRPIRELVLDILDEIGVPSSPGTLSECAAVWAGITLPAGRFASLRRDEQIAFGRDAHARPAWVVPALNAFGFRAIPRSVASSVWEPERRLIGPRTLRVNHLKTVLALLRRFEGMRESGSSPNGERLLELLQRYARSVPGAIANGEDINPERVRDAARSELEAIESLDHADRTKAAADLMKLHVYQQVWGLPTVIEGQGGAMRKAAGR